MSNQELIECDFANYVQTMRTYGTYGNCATLIAISIRES